MKHYTDKEISDKLDQLERESRQRHAATMKRCDEYDAIIESLKQDRKGYTFVSNAWIQASLDRCREIDKRINTTETGENERFGYLHFVKK